MPSIIGADLKVVGNLQCDGDIDVQGTVQGDIEAATVTVDKDARVDGSIRAHSLIVSGSVDGGMEATEISLTSTARVTGELTHETLSVDPGASLEARLSRLSKEKRIAAQIPKPKLKIPEVEPPAAKAAEEKPLAAETTDTDETETPEPGTTDIPEVFDRRKKQATGRSRKARPRLDDVEPQWPAGPAWSGVLRRSLRGLASARWAAQCRSPGTLANRLGNSGSRNRDRPD